MSQTPLIRKLGIKPGYRVFFLDEPAHYTDLLGPLPEKVAIEEALIPDLDFIHFFVKEKAWLLESFPALKYHLSKQGMLWVSWPKGASKVPTDLNRDVVREIGLNYGLVDVKVCSVDATWSGLKFVYRKEDRK